MQLMGNSNVPHKNTNGNYSLQIVPIPLPTTVVVFCARLLLLWPAALVDQRSAGGNPWLSGNAFYSITFRLSIWFSRRRTFPDEASFGTLRACISEDPHACMVNNPCQRPELLSEWFAETEVPAFLSVLRPNR